MLAFILTATMTPFVKQYEKHKNIMANKASQRPGIDL